MEPAVNPAPAPPLEHPTSGRAPRRPPTAASVCRAYVSSGALWAVVAATAAVIVLACGALSFAPGWYGFSAGRLNALYLRAAFFGAISLPLAGTLLVAAGLGSAPEALVRRARIALWLWNAGMLAGCAAVVLLRDRGIRPEPWAAAPALADGVLWLGAAAWASVLLRSDPAARDAAPVAVTLGRLAALALLIYLGLGTLLSDSVGGVSQAAVGALYARGLPALWALPAALAIGAAILPAAFGRPLYGRRALLWGVAAWGLLAALAVPRDLAPDLLPAWLVAPVEVATIGVLVPAVVLGVSLLGTWVGSRRGGAADRPGSDTHRSADPTASGTPDRRRGVPPVAALLAVAGVVALLGAAVADAALLPGARRVVQFTAWDPATGLLPPLVGLSWMAVAGSYAVLAAVGAGVPHRRARRQAGLLLLGGVLFAVPLPVLGIAAAAADAASVFANLGLGPAAVAPEWFRPEALARAPGALGLWFAAGLWWWNVRRAGVAEDAAPGPWTAASEPVVPAPALYGGLAAVLGVSLFVTLFLPLVDPAALVPTPRGAALQVEAGSLRDEGRRRYVGEACAACHTQRVRDAADSVRFGPPTQLGDRAGGPLLAGYRRIGPDLTWVGDRYPDGDALAARLSEVHGPGGAPALPWLFERAGPSPDGMAVAAYLVGLRSTSGSNGGAGLPEPSAP